MTYPSIFTTCAYSWPSSLKVSSRFSLSFSFFPRLRFFPPFPLFLGMLYYWGSVQFYNSACGGRVCAAANRWLLVVGCK